MNKGAAHQKRRNEIARQEGRPKKKKPKHVEKFKKKKKSTHLFYSFTESERCLLKALQYLGNRKVYSRSLNCPYKKIHQDLHLLLQALKKV